MTSYLLGVLLEVSLRGSAVAALVAVILSIARVRSDEVRNRVWTLVLLAMLFMPVLPVLIPAIGTPAVLQNSAVSAQTWLPESGSRATEVRPTAVQAVSQLVPTAVTRAEATVPADVSRATIRWPAIVATVYVFVVLALLSRIVVALGAARRLRRSARLVTIPRNTAPVFVSSAVATPLTVGVVFPRVLLPASHAEWSVAKLSAVLAHERAHIRRWDPLVLCLAYVNRCVFWFNPLVWWLERKLRTTAEHAADDEAVSESGEERFYARVLLDIAEDARHAGRRLAWQGIGVDGTGSLSERIERVLRGDISHKMSRSRRAAVGVACVGVITLVVACRKDAVPKALEPDPEVAARLAQRKESSDAWDRARSMSPEDVAMLEAALVRDPELADERKQLLTYYFWRGDNKQSWDENVAARRRHALWLIEHHPDSDLMTWAHLSSRFDPDGYTQARRLWASHVVGADVSPGVLSNAADFFQDSEKPMAESLLRRLQAADPARPEFAVRGDAVYLGWTQRLGVLYAQVIVGAVGSTLGNVVHDTSITEAHSSYARTVRQTLADSRDPVLLAATGGYLLRNASQAKLDFDHVALGRSYLERALQLDPQAGQARRLLVWDDNRREQTRLREAVRTKQIELVGGDVARRARAGEDLTGAEQAALSAVQYAAVSSLPESERFAYLPSVIELDFSAGQSLANPEGMDRVKRSRTYVQDLLALAPKFRDAPNYGSVMYRAHVALAMHAMNAGDKGAALGHMHDAMRVPRSAPSGTLEVVMAAVKLGHTLLDAGERETVAEFLEDSATRITGSEAEQRLRDAASIRAGRMPMTYQSAMTRR